MIHPGDVLYLRPDPTIPWISPHAPQNTPPGISTISYYDAVAEFSDAVAANDLDAARTVWERLSPDMPRPSLLRRSTKTTGRCCARCFRNHQNVEEPPPVPVSIPAPLV